MKVFNGKGGLIAKISAAVGMITAILVLYWQISDRVETTIGREVSAAEYRLNEKIDDTEKELVASLSEFSKQQRIQQWLLVRDQARTQLRRINRELASHPNDPFLLDEKAYWKELYNKASSELDKLLNPS